MLKQQKLVIRFIHLCSKGRLSQIFVLFIFVKLIYIVSCWWFQVSCWDISVGYNPSLPVA